jgi:cytochrome c553
MVPSFRLTACALAAALLASPLTRAADAPAKAVVCQACHGPEGISASADIPNLAGQKQTYLVHQLEAFRDGTRKNDLMSVIAPQLSADEVKSLAAYWSSLPAAGSNRAEAPPNPATLSLMAWPTDFPKGFTEYARSNDDDGKPLSVNYANAIALAAARAGKPLPDGSAIFVVGYEAKLDAKGRPIADAAGRWQVGKLLSYTGMESRAGWGEGIPDVLRNGTWQYGQWGADGTPRMGAQQPRCLACHKPKAQQSYVFTLEAMRHAAP